MKDAGRYHSRPAAETLEAGERKSLPPGEASLSAVTAQHEASGDRLARSLAGTFSLATTLVYVAGSFSAPTRAGVEANIHAAALRGLEVAKLGACPMIPHCNT